MTAQTTDFKCLADLMDACEKSYGTCRIGHNGSARHACTIYRLNGKVEHVSQFCQSGRRMMRQPWNVIQVDRLTTENVTCETCRQWRAVEDAG